MRHIEKHENDQRVAAAAALHTKVGSASASFGVKKTTQTKSKKRGRPPNDSVQRQRLPASARHRRPNISSESAASAADKNLLSSNRIHEDHAESARAFKKKKSAGAEDQKTDGPKDGSINGDGVPRKVRLPSMASPGSYKGGGMQKNTLAQATTQKPTKKYCLCEATEDGKFMVQCDNCTDWYHPSCVGMTKKEARWVTKFICPICLSKKMLQPAQRALPDAESPEAANAGGGADTPLVSSPADATQSDAKQLHDVKPVGIEPETGVPYPKGKHPRRAVPVEQCSTSGASIQIHKSMSQAARSVGVTYSGRINAACSSWPQEAHGYCWRHPSDDDVAAWQSSSRTDASTKKTALPAAATANALVVGGAVQADVPSASRTLERKDRSNWPRARTTERVDNKSNLVSAGATSVGKGSDCDADELSPPASAVSTGLDGRTYLGKNVEQLCLDTGKVLANYCSQREAARACDGRQSSISMVCRGAKPNAHGFFWRFKGSFAMPHGLSALTGASDANANGDHVRMTTARRKDEHSRSSSASRRSAGVDTATGSSRPPASIAAEPSKKSPSTFTKRSPSPRASRASSTPIEQLCMASGNVLNRFKSQFDAARHLKVGYSASIFATCVGKQRNAHGFAWRFAESKVWSRMRDVEDSSKAVKDLLYEQERENHEYGAAKVGRRRGKDGGIRETRAKDKAVCHEEMDEVDEMDFFSSKTNQF